jgi:predicted Holliday junction resolvase-like endonuclease
MEALIILGVIVGTIFFSWLFLKPKDDKEGGLELAQDLEPVLAALRTVYQKVAEDTASVTGRLTTLEATVKATPGKTLQTIQGSVNNTTGKLGEMIQLLELQATYDRLMVIGDIVDFIGIKFATETEPAHIDFIDIKTGKKAALSSDQRKLRDLIKNNPACITFKTVKVQIT